MKRLKTLFLLVRSSKRIREDMSDVAKDGRTIQLYHNQKYKMRTKIKTLHNDADHKMSYVLEGEGTSPFAIDFDPRNHYVHIEDYAISSSVYDSAIREDKERGPIPF